MFEIKPCHCRKDGVEETGNRRQCICGFLCYVLKRRGFSGFWTAAVQVEMFPVDQVKTSPSPKVVVSGIFRPFAHLSCCLEHIVSLQKHIHMYPGKKGFTLLELMLVVAIMAVLAAIAIPHCRSYIERVEYAKTLQTMHMLERELIAFNLAYGRFPETLAEAGLREFGHT